MGFNVSFIKTHISTYKYTYALFKNSIRYEKPGMREKSGYEKSRMWKTGYEKEGMKYLGKKCHAPSLKENLEYIYCFVVMKESITS